MAADGEALAATMDMEMQDEDASEKVKGSY